MLKQVVQLWFSSDQIVDELSELFGGIFLQEVSGTLDDGVWLTFSAGQQLLKNFFAS